MHHITEDTPPDMLAGAMDLSVRLPDGRDVNMSVERSTPMMDLLVHVTTAHKLRPSEYVLQALEMSGGERALPYKPNTPIGVLDTQRVRVLPKGRAPAPRPPAPPGHQPFESTFRLQVHLPRNQFCVIRVGKHVLLKDVMRRVCEEKNLDPRKYEFRHPADVDKVLDPGRTLNDYEIIEVTVVHRDSPHLPQPISAGDIMALQREEERRKVQAKTGGGVLNLIFRRGRTSLGSGSVSSDTRSISPTQSDDSRSVTPPAVQPAQILPPQPGPPVATTTVATVEQRPTAPGRPKPPQRKRRPAPKPPTPNPAAAPPPPAPEKCLPEVPNKLDGGLTICHSRNSSDSSGYHEASILSDNCNTTLPRRPKSTVISTNLADGIISVDKSAEHARSTGNLSNMTAQSKSTTSLTTAGRKKRAPPPPPALKSARSAVNISTVSSLAPVVASETSVECPDISSSAIIAADTENPPRPKPRIKTPTPVPIPRTSVDMVQNTNSSDVNNQDTEDATNRIRKDSKFDTIGRKRGFQIGKSLFSLDDGSSSPTSIDGNDKQESVSTSEKTLSNSGSHIDLDENFDLEIENIEMFNSKQSKPKKDDKYLRQYHRTEVLAEIHDLEQNKSYSDMLSKYTSEPGFTLPHSRSLPSMLKVSSVPAFLDSNTKVKKWGNLNKLDGETSFSAHKTDGGSAAWVIGDTSDADSNCTISPRVSTNQHIINETQAPKVSSSSITSSDSPIVQETPAVSEPDVSRKKLSEKLDDRKSAQLQTVPKLDTSKIESVRDTKQQHLDPTPDKTVPEAEKTKAEQQIKEIAQVSNASNPTQSVEEKSQTEDSNELETEWQYQLPSPPTAFRDSSPTNFTDMTNYDTITFNGLSAGSVITCPSLYQKLESIKDARSGSETLSEGGCSAESIKTQVLTSKYLSLETLEKRKSLVLERELASLKAAGTDQKPDELDTDLLKSQRNSLLSEIEEVIQNNKHGKSTNLSRTNSQSREKILLSATDSMLPNFKITTYDQPKCKINIFEDDSVRSNVENKSTDSTKRNSLEINSNSMPHLIDETAPNINPLISASMDNVHLAKDKSADDYLFKKPRNVPKYKQHASISNVNEAEDKNGEAVSRSESFSSRKNGWSKPSPVKRSKSHISLEKYRDESKTTVETTEEGLHKSNSLFNVSGLQSLEVMRMILPKLGNSPPNTPLEPKSENAPVPKLPESDATPPSKTIPENKEPTKKYQYSGPPAINLSTWSDRPKCQVSLKEDTDYKISNVNNAKSIFNSQTNVNTGSDTKSKQQKFNFQSYPSVNIRVNGAESKDQTDSGKLNIKINSEPAKTISHQTSGNVIIKIGNGSENNIDDNIATKTEHKFRENNFYTRFINQTTAAGYRRPLGNINGVDKPRPHSIAFDASCPDLSRVPIVRAVELKKPFKDNQGNKSITQIIHDNNNESEISDTPKHISNGNSKHSYDDHQNATPIKSNTLGNQYRHSSVYLSSENLNKNEQNNQNKILSLFSKPVSRGNSFAMNRTGNAPTVKGFRIPVNKELNSESKISWNTTSGQYNTLPTKTNSNTMSNTIENSVPFSQSTLRRTENNWHADKFVNNSSNHVENVALKSRITPTFQNSVSTMTNKVVNGSAIVFAPVPPAMPKVTAVTKKPRQRQVDPRDQLLESIRNFGGRAGLRTGK